MRQRGGIDNLLTPFAERGSSYISVYHTVYTYGEIKGRAMAQQDTAD